MSAPWNPLYLLAQVASEAERFPVQALSASSPSLQSVDSSCSASSTSMTSYIFTTEAHQSPCRGSKRIRSPVLQACPSSVNRLPCPDPNFVPYVRPRKKSRKGELDANAKMQMKTRRKDLMDKANKIKSLENSPVNERQLSVLRMIYDEITMYPCESWMVLVAILINRYVQIQNTFVHQLTCSY